MPREKTRGDGFNGRIRQERAKSVDDEKKKKKKIHLKSDERTRVHSVENFFLKHTHMHTHSKCEQLTRFPNGPHTSRLLAASALSTAAPVCSVSACVCVFVNPYWDPEVAEGLSTCIRINLMIDPGKSQK